MKITFLNSNSIKKLEPLHSYSKNIGGFPLANLTLSEHVTNKLQKFFPCDSIEIQIKDDFWISTDFLIRLSKLNQNISVVNNKRDLILQVIIDATQKTENCEIVTTDKDYIEVKYPWDLLKINEEIISELKENKIEGTIRSGVNIDGFIQLGENSLLLPGVYIEGNVIIGKNCKIGPNCYIRGNTSIGNNCHVGQAVEVKNSIIMDKASIGHLSYVGDSIIGEKTNFGAGTITANLKHDGSNQRSLVDRKSMDTGRRKLGTIVGENVHTGIHTSIYPGRKLWPNTSTLPGAIVKTDVLGNG